MLLSAYPLNYAMSSSLKLCAALVLVALQSKLAIAGIFSKYDEPEWALTANQPRNHTYEVRQYNESKWVSTVVHAMTYDGAAKMGFNSLYNYIRGANDRQIEISMTIPVTVNMTLSHCIFCLKRYVVSFYIPRELQSDPPAPTKSSLSIETRPSQIVYVRSFSGYASSDDIAIESNKLFKDLLVNGLSKSRLQKHSMIFAGYNSPFKLFYRRNEIWISPSA